MKKAAPMAAGEGLECFVYRASNGPQTGGPQGRLAARSADRREESQGCGCSRRRLRLSNEMHSCAVLERVGHEADFEEVNAGQYTARIASQVFAGAIAEAESR